MLVRQISHPIDKKRFKEIVEFLLAHLPNEIKTLHGNVKKINIKFLQLELSCGLYSIAEAPIFVYSQSPKGQQSSYGIVAFIDLKTWQSILVTLPESEHKTFLQCIGLALPPAAIKIEEDKFIAAHKQTRLQKQKNTNALKNFDHNTVAAELLSTNCGLLFTHDHTHVESWLMLAQQLPKLKESGINTLYVELPVAMYSGLFRIFNITGDQKLLAEHINYYCSMVPKQLLFLTHVCVSAFNSGIKVLPFDSSNFLNPNSVTPQSMMANNQYRDNFMTAQICSSQKPRKGKFLVLAGGFHHSVAKKLNIPSIALCPDSNAVSLNPEMSASMIHTMKQLSCHTDCFVTITSVPKQPLHEQIKKPAAKKAHHLQT